MNQCIETMMEEHELIVQVLASLRAMAGTLEAGRTVPRADVADFARFFREFADQCHHGKEEDRLFQAMKQVGFTEDSGPLAVMLYEHEAGRREVRMLRGIGEGKGPLSPLEATTVTECAAQFVPLLYGHIQKENNILYPMAQQALPASELGRLDESCVRFDREVMGAPQVAALRALAEDLSRRYPADVADLAELGGCGACAGH